MTTLKKLMILISCIVTIHSLNAQIKITTGGKTSIGYAGTLPTNTRTHLVGNTLFSKNSSGSGAMIRGNNTGISAGTPDYTWYGDSTSGVFHPASNVIGITLGGLEKFRFSGGQFLKYSTGATSASTPDFSWTYDNNTGMYLSGSDNLSFATGGLERLRVSSTGRVLSAMGSPAGTASAPDFAWISDQSTGIFRPAMYTLAFSNNGSESMRINSTGHLMIKSSAMDNAIVNVTASEWQAAYLKVTHTNDWWGTMTIETNKPNSLNYIVKYNDTTRYYVAGAGWIYSQGNYLGSDINIKDNINTITDAMTKINSIRGVTYKLKDEVQHPQAFGGQAKTYMGVIAQEVEAVAPQVVKTMANGTKAVCYEMLVGLLIEGLKEQSTEINQLKSDINNCCINKSVNGTTGSRAANQEALNPEQTNRLAQNKPF